MYLLFQGIDLWKSIVDKVHIITQSRYFVLGTEVCMFEIKFNFFTVLRYTIDWQSM